MVNKCVVCTINQVGPGSRSFAKWKIDCIQYGFLNKLDVPVGTPACLLCNSCNSKYYTKKRKMRQKRERGEGGDIPNATEKPTHSEQSSGQLEHMRTKGSKKSALLSILSGFTYHQYLELRLLEDRNFCSSFVYREYEREIADFFATQIKSLCLVNVNTALSQCQQDGTQLVIDVEVGLGYGRTADRAMGTVWWCGPDGHQILLLRVYVDGVTSVRQGESTDGELTLKQLFQRGWELALVEIKKLLVRAMSGAGAPDVSGVVIMESKGERTQTLVNEVSSAWPTHNDMLLHKILYHEKAREDVWLVSVLKSFDFETAPEARQKLVLMEQQVREEEQKADSTRKCDEEESERGQPRHDSKRMKKA